MKIKNITALSLVAVSFGLGTTACGPSGNKPGVELIQDMMEQEAVKAQEYDEFFEDHAGGARVPPEHTVPVGFKPYRVGYNVDMAKADKNPFAGNATDEVLLVGQKYYETNCTVCHGQNGDSVGPANGFTVVGDKMPLKPPSLNTDKIKGWTDGQIYQVISMGQGVMGSYASHIPQKYRWQVVSYIRHLQKESK